MEMICPDCMAPMVSADGVTAVCTAHGGSYKILFSRYASVAAPSRAPAIPPVTGEYEFVATPAGSLAAPVPQFSALEPRAGTTEAYAANLSDAFGGPILPQARCINHPESQSVTLCQSCRAAVCATCVFIFPGGLQLCPNCASNPTPQISPKRKRMVAWSVGLGIAAILGFTVCMVWARELGGKGDAELLGGLLFIGALIPAIVGLALGVGTFDRRLATPGIVWLGVVLNGLVVLVWVLLSILGSMR